MGFGGRLLSVSPAVVVAETNGDKRIFRNVAIVISTHGVLTLRNRYGMTVKAYPEGRWEDAEERDIE